MDQQIRNCCAVTVLYRDSRFGDPNALSKTEEGVRQHLKSKISALPLQQLHDWKTREIVLGTKFTEIVTPYMLALICLHKLVNVSWKHGAYVVSLQASGIGRVSLTCDMGELRDKWHQQRFDQSPLTGILFVPDVFMSTKALCLSLIDNHGASQLGCEQTNMEDRPTLDVRLGRGSVRLVFEHIISFALNNGKEEMVQQAAEHFNLFTVTLRLDRESLCTITTKNFANIPFLTAISGLSNIPRLTDDEQALLANENNNSNQQEKEKILVLLGLKDYKTDLYLYSLALYLSGEKRFAKPILVFDEVGLRDPVGDLHFNTQPTWETCMKTRQGYDPVQNLTSNATPLAVDRHMTRFHDQASDTLRDNWQIMLSPVMGPALPPSVANPAPGQIRYRTLKKPFEVYSEAIHEMNLERVTIPLENRHDQHGIQVTTRLVDTPKLLEIAEKIHKYKIPELSITGNFIPKFLHKQV